MSEERKEGVQAWWIDKEGEFWDVAPDAKDRAKWGPFTMEYRHRPPEGAPEPGERRMYSGKVVVVRHVYLAANDNWYVAFRRDKSGDIDAIHLDTWLDLPPRPTEAQVPAGCDGVDGGAGGCGAGVYRSLVHP